MNKINLVKIKTLLIFLKDGVKSFFSNIYFKNFSKWLFNNILIVFFIGLLLWSANQLVEEKVHANNLLFALQSDIIKISGEQQNIKYEQRGATFKYYLSSSKYVVLPVHKLDSQFYNSLNSDDITLIWTIYRSWDIDNFYEDVDYLRSLYDIQERIALEDKQMPNQEMQKTISTQRDKVISSTDRFIETTNQIIDRDFIEFNFISDDYNKFRMYIYLHFKVLKELFG